MGFYIDDLIYLYIYLCIGLILFNIAYMIFTNYKEGRNNSLTNKWEIDINKQINLLKEGKPIELRHKVYLEKHLIYTNQLVAYVRALDILRKQGHSTESYLFANYKSILFLAGKYKNEDVYDRTFFAFFISINTPCNGNEYNSLMEILLTYLDNSNIYCRENVLKALYAIGNLQAVENAFLIMYEHNYFHHYKLLSDGLLSFTGDKEALAERMYKYIQEWDENMVIAVIKFITFTSDKFKERFFLLLKEEEDINNEVRLAIIRYFRNHKYEPAHKLILEFMRSTDITDENIKIVSASVLGQYPGIETIKVLKEALKDPNWYVRYNSATSLINLNVGTSKLQDVLNGEDVYAKEIITYIKGLERKVDRL